MPSASVLGKIFTALPLGDPMYQMIELLFIMYQPFVDKIGPGVFLVCPDCIELFDLGEKGEWKFSDEGFTALAHPSTIEIGTTHGVYVLSPKAKLSSELVEAVECVEVLQKPSEEVMYTKGAIVSPDGLPLSKDSAADIERVVYTDSLFFFDHNITQKLLGFYKEHKPLQVEIDAYGDFLQALGPRATIQYTKNISNVSFPHPDLVPMREKVFHVLEGTPLTVMLLKASKFYHIGTTKEYIHHFCKDKTFTKEMSLSKFVFSHLLPEVRGQKAKVMKGENTVKGCIMHSMFPENSEIPPTSVFEYCDFDVPVHCGVNCIVSNCSLIGGDSDSPISIPDNTFLHSISIKSEGTKKFVTILFGINDNLKKKATSETWQNLTYFKQPLSKTIQAFHLTGGLEKIFKTTEKPLNLWFARLFPVMPTMTASFEMALKMLQVVGGAGEGVGIDLSQYTCLSMADLLIHKDVGGMLEYRNSLFAKIKAARCKDSL